MIGLPNNKIQINYHRIIIITVDKIIINITIIIISNKIMVMMKMEIMLMMITGELYYDDLNKNVIFLYKFFMCKYNCYMLKFRYLCKF